MATLSTAVRRVTILATLVVLFSLLFASPASAHAELVNTTPANGEQLTNPPTEIQMTFTESVNLIDDGIRLDRRRGCQRAHSRPDREGANRHVADAGQPAGGALRRDLAGSVLRRTPDQRSVLLWGRHCRPGRAWFADWHRYA